MLSEAKHLEFLRFFSRLRLPQNDKKRRRSPEIQVKQYRF